MRDHGRVVVRSNVLRALPVAVVAGCAEPAPVHTVVPAPQSVELVTGDSAMIGLPTRIVVDSGALGLESVAFHLAGLLGNWVATTPSIVESPQAANAREIPADARRGDSLAVDIRLTTQGADASLGDEGYELFVSSEAIEIRAPTPRGVFYGVQTLRQLLPPEIEYTAALQRPWSVPAVRVRDAPRYAWRGAMLDVARHFLTVDDVKRFIDLMVPYKLNGLHLHLTDDQGWRIEVPGWPRLTQVGSSTEVGGGPGGYYTLEEYAELVAYADDRFITIVPEIDVPGHTNAALASYPELNCDGAAPEPYTGIEVGFSALCVDREITYRFLDDVVREVSARTTGPYVHIGGDEVPGLPEDAFAAFMARMVEIVRSHGKTVVGWEELVATESAEGTVIQLWRPYWSADRAFEGEGVDAAARLRQGVARALQHGTRFILSPADRVYLDMKYDSSTVIGLMWAGVTSERRTYDWSIAEEFSMIPEDAVFGVEAPLWTETVGTIRDAEYMAFPRLAAVAEIGWTNAEQRSWDDFRLRLAAQGPRWNAQGVNYRRSRGIPWIE